MVIKLKFDPLQANACFSTPPENTKKFSVFFYIFKGYREERFP